MRAINVFFSDVDCRAGQLQRQHVHPPRPLPVEAAQPRQPPSRGSAVAQANTIQQDCLSTHLFSTGDAIRSTGGHASWRAAAAGSLERWWSAAQCAAAILEDPATTPASWHQRFQREVLQKLPCFGPCLRTRSYHMVSAWEVLRHRLQLRLRAGGSATNAVSRRIPPRLQGAPNKRKLATSDTFEDALRMLEARHEKEVHDRTAHEAVAKASRKPFRTKS